MLKFASDDGKGRKKKLLDSSSSSEGEDSDNEGLEEGGKGGLSINKGYAQRYDNWRNLEEVQKLKSRLGVTDVKDLNSGSSSSESSSEEEDEWSPDKEKAFLKTLACLKRKDPKIYEDQFGFFQDREGDNNEEKGATQSKRKKEERKPYTVRDHERLMVLGGEKEAQEQKPGKSTKTTKSYPEELASIKTEFSKALNEIDSSDDEDGGESSLLGSKLLKRRTVKPEDAQQEQEDYKLWLKGELDKVGKEKLSKDDVKELKFLREYWNDDRLDEGEKFLRDYILNKKYIEPLEESDYIPSYNEITKEDFSEEEKFEAEQEEFEHKYNFRFEEPDQEFIKRFPRTIQDSLRRDDTKRKEQRVKAKEKKEELKSKKREEIQRLKALKRKEILQKIQKLHDISGNPDLDVTELDIEGDFDPGEYDRRMQEMFSDTYYTEDADMEKPVFDYDEEIDDEEKWDEWMPARKERDAHSGDENEEESEDEGHEDVGARRRRNLRQTTQEELIEASKRNRGRKKRSVFLDALEKAKPQFDPKVHKSFEKYFDEYYKLDFEDLVEDLPCRFKYHKTTPNDFGLSVDEILKADDKELNQWASLKKTFQYREKSEEEYEVQAYKKKAERADLKKRILLSLHQSKQLTETETNDGDASESCEMKRKKNKKKDKNLQPTPTQTTSISSASLESQEQSIKSVKKETNPNVKRKNKSLDSSNQPVNTTIERKVPESAEEVVPSTTKLSKRQRKNLKRKSQSMDSTASPGKSASVAHSNGQNSNAIQSKKRKSDSEKFKPTKRKAQDRQDEKKINVDDDRLRAYGLNPTKLKKRMKYGAST